MKGVIIIATALLLSVIYASYFYFLGNEEIYQVYQNVEYRVARGQSCKSTVVLINNSLISDYGKKSYG